MGVSHLHPLLTPSQTGSPGTAACSLKDPRIPQSSFFSVQDVPNSKGGEREAQVVDIVGGPGPRPMGQGRGYVGKASLGP
jgi:hypothetical protein